MGENNIYAYSVISSIAESSVNIYLLNECWMNPNHLSFILWAHQGRNREPIVNTLLLMEPQWDRHRHRPSEKGRDIFEEVFGERCRIYVKTWCIRFCSSIRFFNGDGERRAETWVGNLKRKRQQHALDEDWALLPPRYRKEETRGFFWEIKWVK